MSIKSLRFLLIAACVSMLVFAAYAQAPKVDRTDETAAKVPALESFHSVIFKIWHDAWPKKDTAMLQKLLPDVEKGINSIAGAPLPGILREKKAAWDENVKKLQTIGADYKVAANGKDDAKLMDAAEKLHSQYEALARVLRPPLKELEDFHTVLYTLYHYQLPEYNYDKIATSVAELKQKMIPLNAAKLPERLKNKEESFSAGRQRLSKSLNELETTLGSKDEKKIKQAISAMHARFEALSKIFE
jgi:hypothetical protein